MPIVPAMDLSMAALWDESIALKANYRQKVHFFISFATLKGLPYRVEH